MIGVVLGIGLALLILASFGYTFIRWYRRDHARRREFGQGRGHGDKAGDREQGRGHGERAGGTHRLGLQGVGNTGDGETLVQGGSGPSWGTLR